MLPEDAWLTEEQKENKRKREAIHNELMRVRGASASVLAAYGKNRKYSDKRIVITSADDSYQEFKVYVRLVGLRKR